ncbi:cytochrome c oxidase subunit 3 [Paraburkholderia sp. BL6665CI2N2]|uniref:cytochrome c oxidase subunit 3 n=1 Tax=Paraburkholderia sp. BL6665CI2N2 TaxID=1938806 RepID=UPI0010648D36|nr:cytochrome c oxidase subunit 3 [Paraburkholderia sp. BL6665CI2N2]TDY20807.1 cytochrome c oxidase subunit 3 [Paraburkholderia sp. BL6665CI2N2]
MSDAVDLSQTAAQPAEPLPIGSAGERSGGWWGCLTLIATEGALFGYLIFSYLYLALQSTQRWPPEGLPKLGLGIANTIILLSSSVFVWLCERCVRRKRLRWAVASMTVGVLLGIVFVGIQLLEWHDHPYGPTTHLYGSLYFTITGFHMAHVVVGIIVLLFLLLWTALGYFDEKRCAALTIGGLYWHFVDVVWLFIFSTLYLTPYLFRNLSWPGT